MTYGGSKRPPVFVYPSGDIDFLGDEVTRMSREPNGVKFDRNKTLRQRFCSEQR